MINTLSIYIVNGAAGMMFGLSIILAIDVFSFLHNRDRWWLLFIAMTLWLICVLVISVLPAPDDLIVRRFTTASVELWVAFLLWRYVYRTRKERNEYNRGERREQLDHESE